MQTYTVVDFCVEQRVKPQAAFSAHSQQTCASPTFKTINAMLYKHAQTVYSTHNTGCFLFIFSLSLSQLHSHINSDTPTSQHAHLYRGVHVLVSGCLQPRPLCGWRHTTHQGTVGKTGWTFRAFAEICALDERLKHWDVFSVIRQTEAHSPSQSPVAVDWWLNVSLRPEQHMSTLFRLWHTIKLKIQIFL